MSSGLSAPLFTPGTPDKAAVISWLHIGDLHMTTESVQNHHDLRAIVDEINAVFKDTLSFVFLPGDIADDGRHESYAVVRRTLDELQVPWCAIVGDHDVHEKSFVNFLNMMADKTYYSFRVGRTCFLALNAFDIADPGSFTILPDQLEWCEDELRHASSEHLAIVVLLHCYPSELKAGGERLIELIRQYGVRVVDMGHTHYNELSNDGQTLYSATRSTGQIEEGLVGFSVTNLDGEHVSWKFLELGSLPATIITAPGDVRLRTDKAEGLKSDAETLVVRAKIWSVCPMATVHACVAGLNSEMECIPESNVWQATLKLGKVEPGLYELEVSGVDVNGAETEDAIQIEIGDVAAKSERKPRDLDNALDTWAEHGLMGTQLGPNKNGRKW